MWEKKMKTVNTERESRRPRARMIFLSLNHRPSTWFNFFEGHGLNYFCKKLTEIEFINEIYCKRSMRRYFFPKGIRIFNFLNKFNILPSKYRLSFTSHPRKNSWMILSYLCVCYDILHEFFIKFMSSIWYCDLIKKGKSKNKVFAVEKALETFKLCF